MNKYCDDLFSFKDLLEDDLMTRNIETIVAYSLPTWNTEKNVAFIP